MKVWHDWDSGPYETVSDVEPSHGQKVWSEMSEEDWRGYQKVLAQYELWQERLEKTREDAERVQHGAPVELPK
jgi:hypothetical protein